MGVERLRGSTDALPDVGGRCWSTGSRKKSPAADWNPRFGRFLASGIEIGPDFTSPHSSEILILPCGTAQACAQLTVSSALPDPSCQALFLSPGGTVSASRWRGSNVGA